MVFWKRRCCRWRRAEVLKFLAGATQKVDGSYCSWLADELAIVKNVMILKLIAELAILRETRPAKKNYRSFRQNFDIEMASPLRC